MKVSIVVPVYNEEAYLEQCIKSLVNQDDPADEIIIVDNNSTDRSVQIAKKFPVRIVQEKQQGMIPARNRGFNEAKYDIIARTDADTMVQKDWVKRIKKDLASSEYIAVSGRAYFYNLPGFIKNPYWPTSAFKRLIRHDWMFGPNMAIKKAAWEKVKDDVCLDDKDVHEDIDLAIHLGKVGKISYDPKLVVISSPRRWKKIAPYFEYPYRYLKTIQRHREAILHLPSNTLTKRILPAPGKLLRRSIQKFSDF